ncbi:protein with a bacterial immunoglobulin-like domain protein [Legionella santicrucis]|uniref:Protein with a bacterial immunoglobulin-like domain protein n=1 Tax=Legionella santicrucis TaxID=45074 RepID=A0A0W0Y9Q4_9GAMM|nr:Ig-like domain-containing protein [Legionella santicrucis]KTD53578.1 protein with a bacterial immunoglobulin-like domain protein [Legionella santicrucis]
MIRVTIKNAIYYILWSLLLLFTVNGLHAGTQVKFNIVPTTATTKQIPNFSHDTVQYRVTNNTKITRTLTMKPIPGVSQITAGGCSNPFTLAMNESCLLTLSLDGSTLPERVTSGPEICKTRGPGDNTPDRFLCSQPSAANSLNIVVIHPSITLNSIAITPVNPSIANGTLLQFTATAIFSNGITQDVTNLVTWTSANTSVASISDVAGNKGLATANHAGQTAITATLRGVSGNTTLTVTNATLQSIQVTPTNSSIPNGTTLQYTATGIFSNGSHQNLTAFVTWASSTGAASISNAAGSKGLATGTAAGTTVISATFGATTGNTNLTVTPATLTSITVTPVNSSIPNGTNLQFTAMGNFSDGSAHNLTEIVAWTSSSNAASISNAAGSKGLATGTNPGNTTITATLGSTSGSTTLTVTAAILNSITVTPVNPSIANGTNLQFTATGNFSDGAAYDLTGVVAWTSSTNAAAISNAAGSKGLAVGTNPGTTAITATFGSVSGSTTLTVTAATLNSITVTPVNPSIANGTNLQFTAIGNYSDGSAQDITTMVTWNSSLLNVATISNAAGSEGLAKSVSPGATTITATLGSTSGTTNLTVTAAVLTTIEVLPLNRSIASGTTQQFIAIGLYSDGTHRLLTDQVTWASSTPSVAPISNATGSKGLAAGIQVGSTVITASLNSVSGNTTLTVTAATLSTIEVKPVSQSIANGTTLQYTATGVYSNRTTQDLTNSVTWSSSNPSIATIDNATGSKGLATALAVGGPTTISASLNGVTGNASLTVTPATLTSISLSPNNTTLASGLTLQYTATGHYSDNSIQDITTQVVWSTVNQSVAVISNADGSKGLLTAVGSSGTTTVNATLDSVIGSTNITATNAVLSSITVIPNSTTTVVGLTKHFYAEGTFSDSSVKNLTSSVTWTSSNNNVATISNDPQSPGLATGVSTGTVTISATQSGITGVATLTVSNPNLVSISITGSGTFLAGTSVQLTAIGSFDNGSSHDVTDQVFWSSDNTNVVEVQQGGLAKALITPGTATITASSLSGVSGTTPFTSAGVLSNFYFASMQVGNTVQGCVVNDDGFSPGPGSCTVNTGGTPTFNEPQGVALNSSGNTAYVVNGFGGVSTRGVIQCNRSNGALSGCTQVLSSTSLSLGGIAVNHADSRIYIGNGASVIVCSADFTSCVDSGFNFAGDGAAAYDVKINSNDTKAYVSAKVRGIYVCNINSGTGLFDSCTRYDVPGQSWGIALLSSDLGLYTTDKNGGNIINFCPLDGSSGGLEGCIGQTYDLVNFPQPVGIVINNNIAYIADESGFVGMCAINSDDTFSSCQFNDTVQGENQFSGLVPVFIDI